MLRRCDSRRTLLGARPLRTTRSRRWLWSGATRRRPRRARRGPRRRLPPCAFTKRHRNDGGGRRFPDAVRAHFGSALTLASDFDRVACRAKRRCSAHGHRIYRGGLAAEITRTGFHAADDWRRGGLGGSQLAKRSLQTPTPRYKVPYRPYQSARVLQTAPLPLHRGFAASCQLSPHTETQLSDRRSHKIGGT